MTLNTTVSVLYAGKDKVRPITCLEGTQSPRYSSTLSLNSALEVVGG